jgi:crotonobetainyl-CoA:carnitine CoA-transferase CaiB-like acyl-CoA transferase
MMSWDLSTHMRMGVPIVPYDRHHAVNPIINNFQDRDGKWFWLLLLQADRHWPDLLAALGAEHLGEDERFDSIPNRMANQGALVDELDKLFGQRPLAEWTPIFDARRLVRAVNTIEEVVKDPMAEAARCSWRSSRRKGPYARSPHPRILGHAGEAPRLGARAGPGHRGRPPRAGLRLGPHHRAEGRRRDP